MTTAADYQTLAASLTAQTLHVVGVTEQARLRGQTTAYDTHPDTGKDWT